MKKAGKQVEEVNNTVVTDCMKKIKNDPDTDYGYHKMCFALMILGFVINHKKVYRLMKGVGLLHEKHPRPQKGYAKYRTVMPLGPLEVLERWISNKYG